MKRIKMYRRIFKKNEEELQQWIHFRKRGSVIQNKKGKCVYTRKEKHKESYV